MKKLFQLSLLVFIFAGLAFAQTERPDWQNLELTDAQTGESFTLASFEDKTVFVEPMATWCTNCRKQLNNVNSAIPEAGEDVVFIALSVEGNLADDKLAEYATRQEFDMMFAVATPELLTALVEEFGRKITSPPSTPHFIIRPDGSTTELTTGIEAPEVLLAQIADAQN